eukprot:gene20108-26829_t
MLIKGGPVGKTGISSQVTEGIKGGPVGKTGISLQVTEGIKGGPVGKTGISLQVTEGIKGGPVGKTGISLQVTEGIKGGPVGKTGISLQVTKGIKGGPVGKTGISLQVTKGIKGGPVGKNWISLQGSRRKLAANLQDIYTSSDQEYVSALYRVTEEPPSGCLQCTPELAASVAQALCQQLVVPCASVQAGCIYTGPAPATMPSQLSPNPQATPPSFPGLTRTPCTAFIMSVFELGLQQNSINFALRLYNQPIVLGNNRLVQNPEANDVGVASDITVSIQNIEGESQQVNASMPIPVIASVMGVPTNMVDLVACTAVQRGSATSQAKIQQCAEECLL